MLYWLMVTAWWACSSLSRRSSSRTDSWKISTAWAVNEKGMPVMKDASRATVVAPDAKWTCMCRMFRPCKAVARLMAA